MSLVALGVVNANQSSTKLSVTVVASAGLLQWFPCIAMGHQRSSNQLLGIRAYYSAFNDLVDIAAPGGDASSMFRGNVYVWAFDRDSGLDGYQGTSMAAPMSLA